MTLLAALTASLVTGCQHASPVSAPLSFTLRYTPGVYGIFGQKRELDRIAERYLRAPSQTICMAHFGPELIAFSGLDEASRRKMAITEYLRKRWQIADRKIIFMVHHPELDHRFKANPLKSTPSPVIDVRIWKGDCRDSFMVEAQDK